MVASTTILANYNFTHTVADKKKKCQTLFVFIVLIVIQTTHIVYRIQFSIG